MKKILVLQGPNLNLLGKREPEIYGSLTLADIHSQMEDTAAKSGIELSFYQSNSEGELINLLHKAVDQFDGIIMNPGAFSHYSYAIFDAILSVQIPLVEVHISNIYQRESFRHHSVIAPAAVGQITGLGVFGYTAAVNFFADYFYNH